MEHTLKEGLLFTQAKVVTAADTAIKYDSGLVDVFATPALVALMESASYRLAAAHLPSGFSSVGIEISISHVKATPVGMKVEATATLVKIDDRKLYFEVIAKDEEGEIGRGTHVRSIVNVERFMSKLKK